MQKFNTVDVEAVQMTLISDPIVALAAALVGAGIAYLVAKSAARQQRAADDKRQWDKDLKSEFIQLLEQLEVIRSSEGLTPQSTEMTAAAAAKTVALEKLKRLRLSMSLTASPKTLNAVDKVVTRATEIHTDAVGGTPILPSRKTYLASAENVLFAAVKKDLRIKD